MTTSDTRHTSSIGVEARSGSALLTAISYNLWQGRAQGELATLIEDHDPDVLCLQEADAPALTDHLGELGLAIATPRNRLGVAVYVRRSRFEVEAADSFQLTRSFHDRFIGGAEHRLAAVRVRDRVTGEPMVLGSFHATPFTDPNSVRRRQIDDAHHALAALGPGLPMMMAGDYNHPFFLGTLRRHLNNQGFTLASTSASTYSKRGNLMRGPFDLATVAQLTVTDASPLPQGLSDHKPVLFTVDCARERVRAR